MNETEIEIRCPEGPHRLLSKIIQAGGHPHITEGNLIELACGDCKRLYRKEGVDVFRVLHRYNMVGEHIDTIRELN